MGLILFHHDPYFEHVLILSCLFTRDCYFIANRSRGRYLKHLVVGMVFSGAVQDPFVDINKMVKQRTL
jgi:hypothetical protein